MNTYDFFSLLDEITPDSKYTKLNEAREEATKLRSKLENAERENKRLKSKNAQLARRIREVKYPMKSEPVQTLSEREAHSERKDYLNKEIHYRDKIERAPNGKYRVYYTYSLIPKDVKIQHMSSLDQYGIYKTTNTRQEAEEFLYDAVKQLHKIATDREK